MPFTPGRMTGAWRPQSLDILASGFYITTKLYIYLVIVMPPAELDSTFIALADPTRRAILARLAHGEASVMELAAPFAMSQPAISKHLKVLENAGLVTRGRDGARRPVRAVVAPLAAATSWINDYIRALEASYQRLDTLLADLQAGPEPKDPIN